MTLQTIADQTDKLSHSVIGAAIGFSIYEAGTSFMGTLFFSISLYSLFILLNQITDMFFCSGPKKGVAIILSFMVYAAAFPVMVYFFANIEISNGSLVFDKSRVFILITFTLYSIVFTLTRLMYSFEEKKRVVQ